MILSLLLTTLLTLLYTKSSSKLREQQGYLPSRERSCGKVIFSRILSPWGWRGVYPSMHWRRHPPPSDTPTWADTPLDRHPLGRHPPWADTPLIRHPHPQQTATAADGTHPTGMHSSFFLFFHSNVRKFSHNCSGGSKISQTERQSQRMHQPIIWQKKKKKRKLDRGDGARPWRPLPRSATELSFPERFHLFCFV